MSELALLGGEPLMAKALSKYNSIGIEELKSVEDVIKSGCLSGFYGSWEEGFLGGPKVQEFEQAWSNKFNSKYTISVNSNTSGLYAAMGAIGISPGDEVIVPCTTMSATAMAPLLYGGIPVFADIDENSFCIDVNSIKNCISSKTKAIIAVNLFGQAAELTQLRSIADENNIYLVEDNAQAPLAKENNIYTGTVGHIGVFSLNYHKHIHTGEGGMCVTDDDNLASRLQMIRNHAEAIVGPANIDNLTNMIGFNYRMTELSAAVGIVQLNNIEEHIANRTNFAEKLSHGLKSLDGITTPYVREGCKHVYYDWVLKYDSDIVGPSRDVFVRALNAEGFACFQGYVEPLYMLPLFQKKSVFGSEGYPFNLTERQYEHNMCPIAQRLYEDEIIGVEICAYEMDDEIISIFVDSFKKVYKNRKELADWESRQ